MIISVEIMDVLRRAQLTNPPGSLTTIALLVRTRVQDTFLFPAIVTFAFFFVFVHSFCRTLPESGFLNEVLTFCNVLCSETGVPESDLTRVVIRQSNRASTVSSAV